MLSCGKKSIIPKSKMTDILFDMHIADGSRAANANVGKDNYARRDSTMLYSPILSKYGFDIDDFNKSIKYYAERPQKMREMYEDISMRLKAMRDKYAELSIQERKDKNLWNGADSLYIDSDSTYSKFDFDIPVKGAGTYILSADINFGDNDSTYNPRVIAWFEIEEYTDSIIGKKEIPLSKTQKTCTLRLNIQDTSMAYVKGLFFEYDSINQEGRQHVGFKNIYVEYIEDNNPEPVLLDTKIKDLDLSRSLKDKQH